MRDLVGIHSWLSMTRWHLHQGGNPIGHSNERRQVASTKFLQVMRDAVASDSLIGLPSSDDAFWFYGIYCMDSGFSAPQANGRSIFATQGKTLWEQCVMPLAVFGSTHFVSHDSATSVFSPNLDRDMVFSELWWLNYCFCNGFGIGAVGSPFFGGEPVKTCCYNRCVMTDVGDPLCSGICVCLSIVKMFSEFWWLTSCFCEGTGISTVGNPFLGGEDVNIYCHSSA